MLKLLPVVVIYYEYLIEKMWFHTSYYYVDYLYVSVCRWVMEAMTLQLNSGKEKQLLVENLSPYAIRKLLQKIFTVKEWGQKEQ